MKNADDRPGWPGLPAELGELLDEIAHEPVPERLLHLATLLQVELRRHRATASGRGGPSA